MTVTFFSRKSEKEITWLDLTAIDLKSCRKSIGNRGIEHHSKMASDRMNGEMFLHTRNVYHICKFRAGAGRLQSQFYHRGHEARHFFSALQQPDSGFLCLEQYRFYILATRERVVVPADLACEMVPFDPTAGEFRAHYAGFFDPGWGVFGSDHRGAPAVLEVRPHQDDLILRHGQPICAMAYETLQKPCSRLYGACGNNYATQEGPRLSKHFA